MELRGLDPYKLESIIAEVSATYGGNLKVKTFSARKNGASFTLKVRDSRGPGARRSGSGRRGPYACWHAHRDVMRGIFDAAPSAVLKSMLAQYNGADGFAANFPATYDDNAGSMARPAAFGSLCECHDEPAERLDDETLHYTPPVAADFMGEPETDGPEPGYDAWHSGTWDPADGEAEILAWRDVLGAKKRLTSEGECPTMPA